MFMVIHRRHIAAKHPLVFTPKMPYRTQNSSSIAARRLAAYVEGSPKCQTVNVKYMSIYVSLRN